MSSKDSGNIEAAIDAALSRLPAWQPPADFAARLSAAAAREPARPAPAPAPPWMRWLERTTDLVPATLGAALLAWLLTAVPWLDIVSHDVFPWLAAAGFMGIGLTLAFRLLRAP